MIQELVRIWQNPTEKSKLLQQPERLREIINDIPARQWLWYQVCQTDNTSRANQSLDFIITMMKCSRLIWRGSVGISPDIYDEALSRTWEWFVNNIHQSYNPEKSSFITWFNQKLRFLMIDILREKAREEQKIQQLEPDNYNFYPVAPEPDCWRATIQQWLELVENNPRILRQCRMQKHPVVNCQCLLRDILQMLYSSEQFSWEFIAEKYGVEAPQLKRFCQTRCFDSFKQLSPDLF